MLDPSGRNLGADRRFGKRPAEPVRQTKTRAYSARVSHLLYRSANAKEASGRLVERAANAFLDRFGGFGRHFLRVLG
jgi:hypothetical protein